jgi:hypothetical protein
MLSLYRHVSINTQLSAESEKLSWTPNKEDFYAIGYWAMLNSLQIRCLAETLPGVGMCHVYDFPSLASLFWTQEGIELCLF